MSGWTSGRAQTADPLDNAELSGEDHLWLEGFATGNTMEAWIVVFRLSKPQ